ncbi:MAG TPA: hypothetical protein DDZ39_06925 [Flavobacteriaceae bacterium]|jgi:hypothetical protein|nr:hypothetical protein [Flavobacteriaceae bacterium]HBS12499.1 hypothetical protein [Flavobacteriaceae bacterium]
MKNQISLEIKTPCTENFNKFQPTSNGGFCASCKKEVIDFTKMNTQEITTYFKNNNTKNTCGQFNKTQLGTENSPFKQEKKLGFFRRIGLACLALFIGNTLQAQGIIKQTENSEDKPSKTSTVNFKKDILVKGNVTEGSVPLPGVSILLEGTTIGTETDFDGNFEFLQKLKKGDVLVFSFIGMTSQKVTIDNANSASKIELQVNMKMDSCVLLGKVAVKKVYSSKKKH